MNQGWECLRFYLEMHPNLRIFVCKIFLNFIDVFIMLLGYTNCMNIAYCILLYLRVRNYELI